MCFVKSHFYSEAVAQGNALGAAERPNLAVDTDAQHYSLPPVVPVGRRSPLSQTAKGYEHLYRY